jgi:hypothetical protein
MLFAGLVFCFVNVDINLYKDVSIIIKQHGGDIYRPAASCFGLQQLKANYIITGTSNITINDIITKLNCKDIDSNIHIVTIQFIYDCIESNRIFTLDEIISMGYVVNPNHNSNIVTDDHDDNSRKRPIIEDNKSNKVTYHINYYTYTNNYQYRNHHLKMLMTGQRQVLVLKRLRKVLW